MKIIQVIVENAGRCGNIRSFLEFHLTLFEIILGNIRSFLEFHLTLFEIIL